MDEEIRRLIAGMCARAGMIMEDASVIAVTTAGFEAGALADTLDVLGLAANTAVALVNAASRLEAYERARVTLVSQ